MRYYVVDCISGLKDIRDSYFTKKNALAVRDQRNGKDRELWIVIDRKGNTIS